MRSSWLVRRSLTYYWRTNAAVIAGVATSVAVLAGALLVGDSVRGSLRDLVEQRLGRADLAVVSPGFFREDLADDVIGHEAFPRSFHAAAPLIVLPGVVMNQHDGRRAAGVSVYGVDDRFWRLQGVTPVSGLGDRDALVNAALAGEIGAGDGSVILVRVQRPLDVPSESLHGRKDDLGRTLRLDVRGMAPAGLADFSLDLSQRAVKAVFLPLSRLARELEVGARVNTLLVSAASAGASAARELDDILRRVATLEDVGVNVRTTEEGSAVIVESRAGVLSDRQAAMIETALKGAGLETRGIFTYLANTIRKGNRAIPYSLVSAIGLTAAGAGAAPLTDGTAPSIVLNVWAAAALGSTAGDTVALEYFVWEDPGRLVTRTTEFRVASVVPIETGDRDMAPELSGISDSPRLTDWDPPFPVDLSRIRPEDEAYWDRYRTTPKAFVTLDVGQRLWRSRYGATTSIRIAALRGTLDNVRRQAETILRAAIDPLAEGLAVRDVRTEGLAASRGATDFGQYFVYFSFFLVVSALLLAALFFKLGIEQRVREVGLLRAVGLTPRDVSRLFVGEGMILAAIGTAIGVPGAVAYAALLMAALRSWWLGAVGTTALTLHVTGASLVAGAVGGLLASMVCIWWTLRSLGRVSERSLLSGEIESEQGARRRGRLLAAAAGSLALLGSLLVLGAASARIDPAAGFFGAGSAFLTASLCFYALILRRRPRRPLNGSGWWPVFRLGMRTTTYRSDRSALSMAIIASATFILISVGAFRRDATSALDDRRSGTGGYELMVDLLVPVVTDPKTPEGRDALNLFDLDPSVTIEPFRLLAGDDASCLNLYAPTSPRILAPGRAFVAEGRFAFQSSLASDAADMANPWRLLDRVEADGAVPVIGDANSMAYVLHRGVGDDFVLNRGGRSITLRFVAALRDSIFQSDLLMSESNFVRLFPEQSGYQFLLVDAGATSLGPVRSTLENALSDFGGDATGTSERLAAFHQVENTFISTFQALGSLGLLLGTLGLGTVILRNMLERRRELALLGAVGYGRAHVMLMVAAESAVLVGTGLLTGALCAALAIAPAAIERGGRPAITEAGVLLLVSVFVVAMVTSLAAMAAATRAPLLGSLRAE
jgi:hypothetical protein